MKFSWSNQMIKSSDLLIFLEKTNSSSRSRFATSSTQLIITASSIYFSTTQYHRVCWFCTIMLQEFYLLNNCIIHVIIKLSFLVLISIALKCSQFELFATCVSSQFAYFDDMWEQNFIDLHIKHLCILVSWFFVSNLHFADVSLHSVD
jgi:hypothetical protein